MPNDPKRRTRRNRRFGRVLVKSLPAWISAITGVIGLFIGGYGGYQVRPQLEPLLQPAPPSTSPTAKGSPSTGVVFEAPPSCPDQGDAFTALTPAKQDGWDLRWQGCQAIDLTGITFTHDQPKRADGSDYDLAYQRDRGGWVTDQSFIRWPGTDGTMPGPAGCTAEFGHVEGIYEEPARPGWSYCLAYDLGEFAEVTSQHVVFLQVYDVSGDEVTADVWVWRHSA